MKLNEDSVFANRYELQRLLGRGGFSEVWLAKDQWTHLNVAIKVYAPGQGMEEDGMKEFCGELAGVYDINHPNLLAPKHVDSWENMPYLIMPYCPNGSCAKMIGKATEEQMWKVIRNVASGLAYLHGKGLVHQDIKPANVMIDEDGDYLITDFGVSSRARSTLRKSVVSSASGGTTAYMGPERFSQQPAPTKASDIWSFGAMCFELVEGYVPFGEIGGGMQKGGAEIPLISADVSDALKYAITMMLQKETWDRPTAATLMEWSANPAGMKIDRGVIIANEVDAGRTTVRQRDIPVSEHTPKETVTDAPKNEPVRQTKGYTKMWVVIGVMAVVICVLCVLLFGGRRDNPEMPEEEPLIAEVSDTIGQAEEMDTIETVISDKARTAEAEKLTKNDKDKAGEEPSKKQVTKEGKELYTDEDGKEVFVAVSRNGLIVTVSINQVTFKMIKVEGGTFQMGSDNEGSVEKPVHNVTLSDYYICETEVTQAIWKAVMGSNPSKWKGDNLPVETVSWDDCQNFIKKLNRLTGCRFSLPTEAQWEYAARGGDKSRGYMYSGSNTTDNVAWHGGNSSAKTHSVGSKHPNELGLYDMSGNVYEWCQDWYGSYSSSSQSDPTGPSSGSRRILRGGSWGFNASFCRSALRNYNFPDSKDTNYGLRLVLVR